MKTVFAFSVAAVSALLLNSCSTNGDPTTGGIFWSESANKVRVADKQDTLDSINAETDDIRASNRQKQRRVNRLERIKANES